MAYVTTLIAPQQAPFFDDAPLRALNIKIDDRRVLDKERAVDIFTSAPIAKNLQDGIRAQFHIDIICQKADTRTKKLFVADMDATMVVEETLDELAAFAGIKDKIAAITVRAMNGEIDFKEALNERVHLLSGLPVEALQETADKMTLTPGGPLLIKTLKNNGIHCLLVSGGFTFFTNHVANALGFDKNFGNTLNIENDRLTGTIGPDIVDKNFKKHILEHTRETMGLMPHETCAIGDGANDLAMLETAGLGIGWQSKKTLRENLNNHLLYSDLSALIYVLGLK